MILLWGDWDLVEQPAIATTVSPPEESPAGEWDTWDFRGLWNQPAIATDQTEPNILPLVFKAPWQIYPS